MKTIWKDKSNFGDRLAETNPPHSNPDLLKPASWSPETWLVVNPPIIPALNRCEKEILENNKRKTEIKITLLKQELLKILFL